MVEIIPKPAEKSPPWFNILFYFSLGLLLAAVLAYFILGSYLKKAETTLRNLEETLTKGRTAEEITLEKRVFEYQKKIEDFSKVINQHLFSSNFFEFIEKNTHPQVWFARMDLNVRGGRVELSGEAEDFVILHQQLQILRAHPLAEDLNLSKIAIGKKGKVDFGISLGLKPTLFHQ